MAKIDNEAINSIKVLALDMIDKAGSGHPGIVLGAAPIIYALYKDHLKVIPSKPDWINRDRFVMSAGHGSALLYSMLYHAGFDIDLEELKHFRELNSLTPGHPEYRVTPGVDASTGPLGQGIGIAVGMAMAERYLNAITNIEKKNSGIIVQLDNSKVSVLARVPPRFNSYPHFKDNVLIKITEIKEDKKLIYGYLMRII